MKGIVQKFVLQRVEVSGDEQRARKCEARSERKWIGKGKGKDTRAMFRITVAVGASTGFCTCIVLKVLLATYSRFREKSTFIHAEQYFTQACKRGDRRTSQSPSKRYSSEKGLGAMAISEVRSVPFRAQHEEIPSWIPYSNQ